MKGNDNCLLRSSFDIVTTILILYEAYLNGKFNMRRNSKRNPQRARDETAFIVLFVKV